MIVEAKSLDTPLGDDVIFQALAYSMNESADHFAVTNGRQWKIYDSTKSGNLEQKLVVSIDLNESPAQVCLKALALWQPSVMSGQVSVGQTPVLGPTEEAQIQQSQATYDAQPIVSSVETASVLKEGEWQPLSEFNPEAGSNPPDEIVFPNNRIARTKAWKSILAEVANWLVVENLLGSNHCPVQLPNAYSRYIVHTEPIHKSGKEFVQPEQTGPLFVETHLSAKDIIATTHFMIEHVGQDPSQFKVRIS